jgi:hypothetical protein
MATLTTLQLPLPLDEFGLPSPLQTRSTTVVNGAPAWAWSEGAPDFPIEVCEAENGTTADGWDLDHVVLLVGDLDEAVATMANIGESPRLRLEVKGRPTAFFRVGPLLEVIQSPVRQPALYGFALVTDEPLEVLALRWRSMGRDVTDPRDAIQPGRRIFTVHSTETGFAVMSPDRDSPRNQ